MLSVSIIYAFRQMARTEAASVQFSHSVVSDSLRPHESQHARPSCPSPTPRVHSNLCPSSRWCIKPSHPLSSLSPPAPVPPSIKVFSNESTLCMRWPKYWSFSFSISASNEHPGLICFRMDWLDLLWGCIGDAIDMSSSPGLGWSPGEGNDNLLQYSYLGNPMDRGA